MRAAIRMSVCLCLVTIVNRAKTAELIETQTWGVDSRGSKELRIRWKYTWAPPGEYD